MITDSSWGSVETSVGTFRDAKLWPGGGRNWDWNETGTEHRPGVQAADLEELLEQGAELVIVGRGRRERLGVTDEAADHLEQAGVGLEALETGAAIDRYNHLAEDGRMVGALIHSTC